MRMRLNCKAATAQSSALSPNVTASTHLGLSIFVSQQLDGGIVSMKSNHLKQHCCAYSPNEYCGLESIFIPRQT